MILTRFFRVTFTTAHKYLGLTSEVLRTEKSINDIACHPLPTSFYEGGGLQFLRQRFDGTTTSTTDSDSDYFGFTQSPTSFSSHNAASTASLGKISDNPISVRGNIPEITSARSRHSVHAGDLLIPQQTTSMDGSKALPSMTSVMNTPRIPRSSDDTNHGQRMNQARGSTGWSAEDFDLREEVMSCIAKSIGLLQPSISGSDSVEASPGLPPVDLRRSVGTFDSPFGSLSLLDLGDDVSSATGASSVLSSGNHLGGLDNEVEILFFPAGSTLVKAGEQNTGEKCVAIFIALYDIDLVFFFICVGLFYVIEGFLDILLPEKDEGKSEPVKPMKVPETEEIDAETVNEPWRTPSLGAKKKSAQKFLFTVKPGGIAGYLGPSFHIYYLFFSD